MKTSAGRGWVFCNTKMAGSTKASGMQIKETGVGTNNSATDPFT
jgi:hypothetical protein